MYKRLFLNIATNVFTAAIWRLSKKNDHEKKSHYYRPINHGVLFL